jgi:hypothetical protein
MVRRLAQLSKYDKVGAERSSRRVPRKLCRVHIIPHSQKQEVILKLPEQNIDYKILYEEVENMNAILRLRVNYLTAHCSELLKNQEKVTKGLKLLQTSFDEWSEDFSNYNSDIKYLSSLKYTNTSYIHHISENQGPVCQFTTRRK